MKKAIFIFGFLLIPLLFAYSQDKKETSKRDTKTYKVFFKDITCPDCQGWGWTIGEGFKRNLSNSVSTGTPNPVGSRGVQNTGLDRYRCMYCNGSGKILAKFVEL